MKHQIEYSREFGYSDNYLSTYRFSRKIPKTVNALQVKEMYETEKAMQDKLMEDLQTMYYELSDNKKVFCFGEYLVKLGIYSHERSLHRASYNFFYERYGLLSRTYVEHKQRILEAYEEWKNAPRNS